MQKERETLRQRPAEPAGASTRRTFTSVVPVGGLPLGGRCEMLGSVPALADTARFRADDPDSLVIASLACPLCLGSEQVRWRASVGGYDPCVRCDCPDCEERWTVYLAPQQALRLSLMRGA